MNLIYLENKQVEKDEYRRTICSVLSLCSGVRTGDREFAKGSDGVVVMLHSKLYGSNMSADV